VVADVGDEFVGDPDAVGAVVADQAGSNSCWASLMAVSGENL